MITITLPATCPHCQATLTASSVVTPTPGAAVRVAIKDWRIWAFSFGATVVTGVIAGALHLGSSAVGAAAGGVGGILIARRMSLVRLCGACGKAVS
ncbi:MAG: hypothetical protein IV100_21455 [Myxococcales bacterium]|nr:hypothetical protein [Myxococcales bacterium]